jgi:signal transduction histidine kinase
MSVQTTTSTASAQSMPSRVKPSITASTQLQSLCELQIEQLLGMFPLICVQVTYYDPHIGGQQSLIRYCDGRPQFDRKILDYLSEETWLSDALSVLTIARLESKVLPEFAYACPLAQRDLHPEYLLFFAPEPLTLTQEQTIQKYAACLAQHLELYQNNWRQKSEIALLEQVVQRAGHQLRNPLALIALYAENLCLGLPEGKAHEQAAIIRETVADLNANLTELIYCGQAERLRYSAQDLRLLITEVISGLQPWLDKKHICIALPDHSLTLMFDRLQMKQVFDNLLNNAVYFSPEGSTIRCRWRSFQTEVLIEVADQGPGMSQQDLENLFTPFYSKRPGGTGLGLAIAKKIILDHQGSLWAQNLPVGGAQFSMSLPRSHNS